METNSDISSLELTITRPEFLANGSDAAFRQLIYHLLISSVQMEKIREQIGNLIDVNGLQYHVLTVISELAARGSVTVGDVARTLQAGNTHITMETTKLVKRGLIEKSPNQEDRRSILVSLSKKGRAALASLTPVRQEINNTIFEGFTKGEFEDLQRLIGKMVGTTTRAMAVGEKIKAVRNSVDDAA